MNVVQKTMGFYEALVSKTLDRLSPVKVPNDWLRQPPFLKHELPYDSFLNVDNLNFIVLKDGSLGMAWRLVPLQHEAMSLGEIEEKAARLSQVIGKVTDNNVVVQVMMDSEPSPYFPQPAYTENPVTPAQEAMKIRVDMIQKQAGNTDPSLATLMSRKFYVFFLLPRPGRLGVQGFSKSKGPDAEILEEAQALENHVQQMRLHVQNFENALFNSARGTSDLVPLSLSEFLYSMRDVLNSCAYKNEHAPLHWSPYAPELPLDMQCCGEPVARFASGVEVGGTDTWQVLSWQNQGACSFMGMMASLLRVRDPIRVVLNLRPHVGVEAKKKLELKSFFLRGAFSADGRKQRTEVENTLDRMAHNEPVVAASLHVLLRQRGKRLVDLEKDIVSKSLINSLDRDLGITFCQEKFAAPIVFDLCLPFGYHVCADMFSGREQLILVDCLTHYLPVLGGFLGSSEKVQLMQSRAGNACYLSTWPSQVPHICIIGGSGAGKSVITANFLTAQLATHTDANVFIIDNKTSYTMVAKALAPTPNDYKIFYPPYNFPNIFLGDVLDHERLELIVSLIKTAITLCDASAVIKNEHMDILKRSIEVAVIHKTGVMDIHKQHTQQDNAIQGSLTMDEIVNCFPEVCQLEKLPQEEGSYLRTKLRPFLSSGMYGVIFNQEAAEALKNDLCQISIYDMDGVSYDPILRTLTTQICMLDIIRIIKNKANLGKKGVFLIDEAGFLLDSKNNPALVNFIDEAWKTFRKLNILCMGIANSITDYKTKQACKTIWNVSPNKFILPMTTADVEEARRVDGGPQEAPLFTYEDELLSKSLTKVPGKYSQIYFRSDDCGRGTFIYTPTGCDYWLSVSRKEDIESVERVAEKMGGYWQAIKALASIAPFGFHTVKDGNKSTRVINEEELALL